METEETKTDVELENPTPTDEGTETTPDAETPPP